MRTKTTECFELGRATIFVTRATLDLDLNAHGYYRCDVHPVGGPTFRVWLRAASREDAAAEALRNYEITRRAKLNLNDGQ